MNRIEHLAARAVISASCLRQVNGSSALSIRSPLCLVAPSLTLSSTDILSQRLGQLEGPHDAAPGDLVGVSFAEFVPSIVQVPGVRPVESGEQVEQRRLSRSVGADQTGDRAALKLQVADIDRLQPTEGAG